MTKLLVLPLMLASVAGITGGTAAEAKPWVSGPGGGDFINVPRPRKRGPGGRDFINVPRPKKRCTFKRPCSPMPELNDFDFGRPMPRGGLPDFGTPMPRGGLRR